MTQEIPRPPEFIESLQELTERVERTLAEANPRGAPGATAWRRSAAALAARQMDMTAIEVKGAPLRVPPKRPHRSAHPSFSESDPPAKSRKLSVSLPADLESELRERAEKGDVSGYIAEAIRQRLEADRLAELIHWLREKNGQVPEDVQAEVDAEWPAAE